MYRSVGTPIGDAPKVRWRGRLKFEYPLHAYLRAWIYTRDRFTCQHCGVRPESIPENYNGRLTLETPRGMMLVLDHIISLRRGGDNSAENLQTLCDSCNARKVTTHDKDGAIYA